MHSRSIVSAVRGVGSVSLLLALLFCPVDGRAEELAEEYRLKAVLLSKLFDFVYWPDTEDQPARTLCVAGDDPFGLELEGAFAARPAVTLRRLGGSAAESLDCDALFVSASEQHDYRAIIEGVEDRAVLTISDIPRFATNGGMINLALVNRRVRFKVNQSEVERAGIKLSYKLLQLADVVDRQAPRGRG